MHSLAKKVPNIIEGADREARETLRALRDGQNHVANVLQQLTQAIQQMNTGPRRPQSHHSEGGSAIGTPRGMGAPT